jgi:hypothetical protein
MSNSAMLGGGGANGRASVGVALLGLSPSALISSLVACGVATRLRIRSRKKSLWRMWSVPVRGRSKQVILPALRPPLGAGRLLGIEPFICPAAGRLLGVELFIFPAVLIERLLGSMLFIFSSKQSRSQRKLIEKSRPWTDSRFRYQVELHVDCEVRHLFQRGGDTMYLIYLLTSGPA